jgi:hypothetical protein
MAQAIVPTRLRCALNEATRRDSNLDGYSPTKSALRLGPDKPLPPALVRKVLTARMAEGKRR